MKKKRENKNVIHDRNGWLSLLSLPLDAKEILVPLICEESLCILFLLDIFANRKSLVYIYKIKILMKT